MKTFNRAIALQQRMAKPTATVVALVCAVLFFHVIAGSVSAQDISLNDAIERTAESIRGELPPKTRIAIVMFESDNEKLSAHIISELTGAFLDRKVEVVSRQTMEYIEREMQYQLSGAVSDDEAKSIGKQVAADILVTGQLQYLGSSYRFTAAATDVESAVSLSAPRYTVRDDQVMKNMIAALSRQAAAQAPVEKRAPAAAAVQHGSTKGKEKEVTADLTRSKTPAVQSSAAPSKQAEPAQKPEPEPQTAGAFFDRGNQFSNEGDYAKAIKDFTAALKLDPNMAPVYLNRGIAYTLSGNYKKAIADYSKSIKIDPNNTKAYYIRGTARLNNDRNGWLSFIKRDDNSLAIKDFTKAILIDPNNAAAYLNRGTGRSRQGKLKKALADYDQAIQLNLNEATVYNNRGYAYINKNWWNGLAYYFGPRWGRKTRDKALADYEQAIRIDPNYLLAYYNRATTVYILNKDYDLALADMNKIIQIDPKSSAGYFGRALVYNYKKDLTRAIEDAEEAIRLNNKNLMAKINLELYRRQRLKQVEKQRSK
jgi:tetratricopeptide (TPR) repeat protein